MRCINCLSKRYFKEWNSQILCSDCIFFQSIAKRKTTKIDNMWHIKHKFNLPTATESKKLRRFCDWNT